MAVIMTTDTQIQHKHLQTTEGQTFVSPSTFDVQSLVILLRELAPVGPVFSATGD